MQFYIEGRSLFHNTTVRIRCRSFRLARRTVRRALYSLCGLADCRCPVEWRRAGDAEPIILIEELDGSFSVE